MIGPVEKKIYEVIKLIKNEDPFFILDKRVVENQFTLWKKYLPKVQPHYAVKCNNNPKLVKQLFGLGAKFDCASLSEIKQILDMGVPASAILYANPVKQISHLKFAATNKVPRTTFDNLEELDKIKKYAPDIELLLRIETDDSNAVCALSCKYGAHMDHVEQLLAKSKELQLNVVGVAYHVGSGGGVGVIGHQKALEDSLKVFKLSAKYGMEFKVLDIGGGFENNSDEFVKVAETINKHLPMFPNGIEVVAEPGRFMAAPSMTLVAQVIGVRRGEIDMVYLSDGVYGNLNSIIYDHQKPEPFLLNSDCTTPQKTSLWGPTCDGLDCVYDEIVFPRRLEIGDFVGFKNCGAYTLVGGSSFNGFNPETEVYTV